MRSNSSQSTSKQCGPSVGMSQGGVRTETPFLSDSGLDFQKRRTLTATTLTSTLGCQTRNYRRPKKGKNIGALRRSLDSLKPKAPSEGSTTHCLSLVHAHQLRSQARLDRPEPQASEESMIHILSLVPPSAWKLGDHEETLNKRRKSNRSNRTIRGFLPGYDDEDFVPGHLMPPEIVTRDRNKQDLDIMKDGPGLSLFAPEVTAGMKEEAARMKEQDIPRMSMEHDEIIRLDDDDLPEGSLMPPEIMGWRNEKFEKTIKKKRHDSDDPFQSPLSRAEAVFPEGSLMSPEIMAW
jgi:hypothetical protein